MGRGFFESDEAYQQRTAREANERTIEESTGRAPSKGFFESDKDYADRVSREASERIVEDSTGHSPSKGWFENEQHYSDRIAREANERIVTDSTGHGPSQGWFESDEKYAIRVRKEANESQIEHDEGQAPRQGFFESDHAYRSRISRRARELRSDAPESYVNNPRNAGGSFSVGVGSASRTTSRTGVPKERVSLGRRLLQAAYWWVCIGLWVGYFYGSVAYGDPAKFMAHLAKALSQVTELTNDPVLNFIIAALLIVMGLVLVPGFFVVGFWLIVATLALSIPLSLLTMLLAGLIYLAHVSITGAIVAVAIGVLTVWGLVKLIRLCVPSLRPVARRVISALFTGFL